MSDIDSVWLQDKGYADFVQAGADLQTGHDLMTAVLHSLFTDRTARADDVIPDGTALRRGWWGTNGESVDMGSRLWLLDRSKLTPDVALKAVDYATEGLQWMIDDGAVAGFVFATEIRLPETLILQVSAYRTIGQKTAGSYAWTWSGPVLYPVQPGNGQRAALATELGYMLVTEDGTVITI